MAEELNQSLEYTPTWIVAVICSIIVFISLCAERALHRLGKYLKKRNQNALYDALTKLEEELMLLGFISLLLTVFQGLISHICITPKYATQMLPCSLPNSEGSEHDQIHYDTIINRRRILSTDSGSEHCRKEGKLPLLSLESLHHLHIFIFVLAVVHVVFCVTTMILGGARIRQWKRWESDARRKTLYSSRIEIDEFFNQHAQGYWRKAAVVSWLRSFVKQFYGSVTKYDYLALRHGFIKEHYPNEPDFDFYNYLMQTLEVDFRKVIGISWYLWLFVVLFLLLNLEGWHTYFWLAFLPLILLLLVGAKLEHIITRLGQESVTKQDPTKRVKPSDEYFWFGRPAVILDLLHFTLFQNAFEIAFFFWIWTTYGFDSCIMEKIAYIIPRLVIGVIVQVLCSYSTLPLYTLVTQMGTSGKIDEIDDIVESPLIRAEGASSPTRRSMSQKMTKESNQHSQFGEQAIIMMEDIANSSTIELTNIVQDTLERNNAFNSQ